MIEIKDPDVVDGMLKRRYHVILRRLIRWFLVNVAYARFTESYRPMQHPDDLHGTNPVRATDIGAKDVPKPEEIADKTNEVWEYDYKRPEKQVCVFHARCPNCDRDNRPPYHDICECGEDIRYYWHFHLQVHDNTRRRE